MLELGDYRLRILHTPGHTSGSICLYEPDHRLLFTGDTVMAGGMMGGIFGSGNISDYIATLKRLATLRVDEFYPGHGRLSTDPTADMEVARTVGHPDGGLPVALRGHRRKEELRPHLPIRPQHQQVTPGDQSGVSA